MNKRLFLASLGGTFVTAALGEEPPPKDLSFEGWQRRVADALEGFQSDPDRLTDVEIGDLGGQLSSREPSIALPAIFTTALRGALHEKKWWTAGNNEADVRIAIVALYELCAPESEPRVGYFESNAKRFADGECIPRLAEVALVRDRRSAFAAAFHAAIKKNPSKNPRVMEFRSSFERHSRVK